MTLLLLGAGGFIGRHVVAAGAAIRERLGVSVVAAPREIDIRDKRALCRLVAASAPSHVLHLAAISFVPDSFADPWSTYEVNVDGTVNLLEALTQARFAGPMVFASSAEVYGAVGEAALPVDETQMYAPRTPYGISKVAAELACRREALYGSVDVRIVRPFNVIGPGQSSKFAVSSFARQVATLERAGGGTLAVGSLGVTRDFVAVEDVVSGMVAVLRDGTRGEAYNIASGTETRLDGVVEALIEACRVPVQVRVDPARVRAGEQQRIRGSSAKLQDATGWQPRADLSHTLRQILDDWRRRETP